MTVIHLCLFKTDLSSWNTKFCCGFYGTLSEGDTPPRFLIIDYGWQQIGSEASQASCVVQEGAQFANRLTGIKENKKFQKNGKSEKQGSGMKIVVDTKLAILSDKDIVEVVSLEASLVVSLDSAPTVVRKFYEGINGHDLASVEKLIAENCVYEDIFPQPFVGRKVNFTYINFILVSFSLKLDVLAGNPRLL